MQDTLTWKLVDDTAATLGVGESARLKWRQTGRGVPATWQIKIARELMTRGVPVSLDDFARLPSNPGRVAA